jgi:hypothetical protein
MEADALGSQWNEAGILFRIRKNKWNQKSEDCIYHENAELSTFWGIGAEQSCKFVMGPSYLRSQCHSHSSVITSSLSAIHFRIAPLDPDRIQALLHLSSRAFLSFSLFHPSSSSTACLRPQCRQRVMIVPHDDHISSHSTSKRRYHPLGRGMRRSRVVRRIDVTART